MDNQNYDDEHPVCGPKLAVRYGPRGQLRTRIRTQLYLTPFEYKALQTLGHFAAMAVGRRVSHALIVRLALSRLLSDGNRCLNDPAVMARLKADLLAVREERLAEHE
jgi:hypothetical protein